MAAFDLLLVVQVIVEIVRDCSESGSYRGLRLDSSSTLRLSKGKSSINLVG